MKNDPTIQLAPEVETHLSELARHLRLPRTREAIWQQLLTSEQRQRFGVHGQPPWAPEASKSTKTLADIIVIWSILRSISPLHATVDLGLETDLLSERQHRRLLLAIGIAAAPPDPADRPKWDAENSDLCYQGQVVRHVRADGVAVSLTAILNSFESQGWPRRIVDPLPGVRNPERLRKTLAKLRKGLQVVYFRSDGTGQGVIWEVRDVGGASEAHRVRTSKPSNSKNKRGDRRTVRRSE